MYKYIILSLFSVLIIQHSKCNKKKVTYNTVKVIDENENSIRNVNIQNIDKNLIFVTDTSGIVQIPSKYANEEFIVKKFGYYSNTIDTLKTINEIILFEDTSSICKNIQFINFYYVEKGILIKLNICGEDFLFFGPVFLGNGLDIGVENQWTLLENENYCNIFYNHEIEETYAFDAEECKAPPNTLFHEGWIQAVLLIYYKQELKEEKTNYAPKLSWKDGEEQDRDVKTFNLKFKCPCEWRD